MASSQPVDQTARYFITEERPVRVLVGAFECQYTGKREKRVVVARHTFDQLRRALGSGEREPRGIDHDGQHIDAVVGHRQRNRTAG
jgi:hypothetical protein